jgi:hypothetical protein
MTVAVSKVLDEKAFVRGDPEVLLSRCQAAMTSAGFMNVRVDRTFLQVSGMYRKPTASGRLDVSVRQRDQGCELAMRAIGDSGSVFARRNPNERILRVFKDQLDRA